MLLGLFHTFEEVRGENWEGGLFAHNTFLRKSYIGLTKFGNTKIKKKFKTN